MPSLTRHYYKEGSFLSREVSQLRKDTMQSILRFLNEPLHSSYNKSQLMHQLNAAERGDRISDAQLHAIRTWLESGYVGVISEYYHVDTPRGIKRKRHERSAKEDGRIVKNKREKPLEQEQSPVQENSKSVKSESEDPLEQDIGIQECLICAEELTTASFPHQISADCMHRPTCCSACLSRYLEEQINDKPRGQIACPECPIILSYDNVKSLAREEHFITYEKNFLLSSIRKHPKFTYCLGPDCKDGQIHEGGDDQPMMTCKKCSFKTCFTHQMPWHGDHTCGGYDTQQRQRREQEQASQAYLAKQSTMCPVCGAHVSKTYGCDNITCRCGAEFCYECGVDYKIIGGNKDRHGRTCPHYSENPPPYFQQAHATFRRRLGVLDGGPLWHI
ncbi:hypothetical protein EYC84_001040 [Monilinia fructicola]|uniref:RBR-type E3 ubiquitin transferase n=1 Tax=Monilinia fructicola TaxID=38448 RepID=A0A5M9JR39_MONFR|nr:hypothetical protein EYC84_001040 [Monilinia fructicola]